ncbi:phosphotransferase family protein [Micropruina sp.]|uniref:phosphotransferase family protein n=1 Tax=Micropruina sp. TaxID=2737536 RepID=UPI0039E693A9
MLVRSRGYPEWTMIDAMQTRTRLTFAELPGHVHEWVEGVLGAPVVRTEPASGGYSPGVAEGLFTADGSAVFLKAGHPSRNPDSPALLRSELRTLRSMPSGLPIAELIDALDEGPDGWVALVLEHVPGRQAPLPWTNATIEAVLASLADLRGPLTPAPPGQWDDAADALRDMFSHWPELADAVDLDPWLAERRHALAAAADEALTELAGDTLVHLDLRADNLMLRTDGRLIVVDWAWAVRGPAWLDPALLAIEFISSAEPDVDTDAWIARIADDYGISADLIVQVLVGILSFFEHSGRRPDPPGLPTLREFQRFQATALRDWLKRSRHASALQAAAR